MFKNPLKHLFVCLLGCLSVCLVAQDLQHYQYHTILQGATLNLQVPALDYPEVLKSPSNGTLSKFKLNFESQYRLRYRPGQAFIGIDTLIYRVDRNVNGAAIPRFEGAIVTVAPISPTKDFYALYTDQVDVQLSVTQNDQTVDTNITIVEIAYVDNGTAKISEDGLGILFTPDQVGYSHVEYLVCNDEGCASGEVLIRVDNRDEPYVTTSESYLVAVGESAMIVLPPGHEPPNKAYYNGTLVRLSDQIYQYTPKSGDLSTTQLKFSKWKHNHYIYSTAVVEVFDPFAENGWSNNDFVFTEVGRKVTFSVSENDLGGSLQAVLEDELLGELAMISEGVFNYQPPDDFNGQTFFDYVSCREGRCDTARVLITAHNYIPRQELWQLSTPQDEILSLHYDVPIDEYKFEILQAPLFGTIDLINAGQGMQYHPAQGFLGTDAVVIQYCVQNAGSEECHALSLFIDVTEFGLGENCHAECVWPGDADDDGWVSISDLMPLGANMGSSGMPRVNTDLSHWYGRSSQKWTSQIPFGTSDLSHADCDGNGFITPADIELLTLHYGKSHQIVATPPPALDPIKLHMELLTPDLSAGDQAIVEVSIDQDLNPTQILGVNFSVYINRFFVDSSSLSFHLSSDQLIDPESGTLSVAISPKDGQLDVGVVKTDQFAVMQHGVLGHITFIVEEDLNGFRSADNLIDVGIELRDVYTFTANGSAEQQLNSKTNFSFSKAESVQNKTGINVFPIPTADVLEVISDTKMTSFRIMDLQGRVAISSHVLDQTELEIDVSHLLPALYLLEIQLENGGLKMQKIQIIP